MDFIKGLPKSKGMNTILVVVDPLSKYAHFVAMRHPFTAQTVVVAFVKEVVKLHGIPRTITTDRDKVFTSHFWTELFWLQGAKLWRSSANHPQTDEQAKVVNRSMETYLCCFVGDKPKQWL